MAEGQDVLTNISTSRASLLQGQYKPDKRDEWRVDKNGVGFGSRDSHLFPYFSLAVFRAAPIT